MSTHYNGPSDPALQRQADALRARFANSRNGFSDKVEGFTFDGEFYQRNLDGSFADPISGKILDLSRLLRETSAEDQLDRAPWDHPIDPPAYLDWAALDGGVVPPQEWVVPGWIPRLETTGLGGAGGASKTTLAQMLATGGAIGMPWLRIDLPFFKTYAILCEDRPNDVWRRQEKINRHFRCTERDLADRLRVWPRRPNNHNYLMIFDRDGIGHPSSFFHQVIEEVKGFQADLTILDTKADLFFGNQNDENQARTFVRQCTDRIAEATGGAVLLIYHPSRAGMRDDTGQSGSVQWDGAFRARLLLTIPEPGNDDEAVDEDARVLTRVKANFARRNDAIEMKWEEGVLIRTDEPAPGAFMGNVKKQKADRVFRQLFDENMDLNHDQPLSNNVGSPRYAPKIFASHPHSERVSLKEFEGAMRRALLPGGGFEMVKYGPPSRRQFRIAKVVQAAA